jgi:hypothetical protein
MKALKTLLAIAVCMYGLGLNAQSYGQMQSRFEKKNLEPADSAAFVQSGIQKAQSLFEYNDVYLQNYTNRSNQMYVEQKAPELFYINNSDSLDLEAVMAQTRAIVQKQNGKPVEIKYTEKEGVLGQVTSVDTEPTFTADLILLKVKKSFGTTSKKVWQVFLANPTFQD